MWPTNAERCGTAADGMKSHWRVCVCACVCWCISNYGLLKGYLKVSVTLWHLCESKILGCVLYLSGHDLSLRLGFSINWLRSGQVRPGLGMGLWFGIQFGCSKMTEVAVTTPQR